MFPNQLKKDIMKIRLLVCISLLSTLSYAQTFDWSSVSYNGSFYVRQTVSGVQAECTNSSNTVDVLNGGGFAGSSGNVIASTGNVASFNVAFSEPINIQSIFAFDGNVDTAANWTFTPTGGTNSNVVENIAAATGSTVNVNWTNVTSFTITSSSGLDRFSIDDIVFSSFACGVINIPDVNFKAYLVGNTAINTNGDSEIQCAEATSYSGIINCSYQSVSDLTGIEAFINITELYVQYNSITNLNVSTNTALVRLNCSHNNSLTNLDVFGATALQYLWCESSNSLTTLDVSGATALRHLYCYDGALTSINISDATALETLKIYNNLLTSLDVSANSALRYLVCNNNLLTNLDVSANTDLRELDCQNNSLTSLNVANGNNTSIYDFFSVHNTGLNCISVDDVAYSDANWTNIDPASSFSTNCSLSVATLETDRIAIYPNPVSRTLKIQLKGALEKIEVYSILGTKVLESKNPSVNVSNLSSGMYVLKAYAQDGKVGVKRFIKQ